MLSKILTIAWTNIYITYTDRGALLLMLLVPVALSTIIALAFGQAFEDVELETSEVVVINQDEGAVSIAGEQNFGQIFVDVLTANDPDGLGDLIHGETGTDINAARQQVEDGGLNAVVVIPADFSQKVSSNGEPGQIDVYYNPGDSISATIIISVVERITAQLNAGQAAQTLLVGEDGGYFIDLATESGQMNEIGAAAEDALTSIYSGGSDAPIVLNQVNIQGEEQEFDPLQYFAPSMAILFMTFAMAAGTRSVLEEQRTWTLQRILTTPTPRWVFMFGKLLGTFASGVLQMLILLVVTPVIAVALGRDAGLWGDNYLGLALVTLAVVGAGTGLGLLLAAVSETPRQADNYANAVLIVLAMLGGTFVQVENVPVLSTLSNVSLNKWALDGFTDLAVNNAPTGDILLDVTVLFGMAALFFGAALWRFNRRLDI